MRSKPDPVDQPERTAHYDCAMCVAEMLHNTSTETVLLIFPFLQTNITVQMWPSGSWGNSLRLAFCAKLLMNYAKLQFRRNSGYVFLICCSLVTVSSAIVIGRPQSRNREITGLTTCRSVK